MNCNTVAHPILEIQKVLNISTVCLHTPAHACSYSSADHVGGALFTKACRYRSRALVTR